MEKQEHAPLAPEPAYSDNAVMTVINLGRKNLLLAMGLAFGSLNRPEVSHYKIDPKHGMILFWDGQDKGIALPYKMNAYQATEFVWGWLEAKGPDVMTILGEEPDHDGSNSRGWKLITSDGFWKGHIGEYRYVECAVAPDWLMHGK